MRIPRVVFGLVLACVALAPLAKPSHATTLIRQGLDRLAAENDLVVEGRVLEIHSYWNGGHSFILTDVTVHPSRVLKGERAGDVTFTVMGGTAGDLTTVIVSEADLTPGSPYVLFLSRADLPGAVNRLTLREHSQGVFDVAGGRAFSQARDVPLAPDAEGRTDVPGGADGLLLDELERQVHAHDGH